MINFFYFIPYINHGPPPGYSIIQELPLDKIKRLIFGNVAEFEIIRKIFSNNKLLLERKEKIFFKNGVWKNSQSAYFAWKNNLEDSNFCYIETQMNLIKGKGLSASSLPSFYVNYIHDKKKNFLSDGTEKYGNPRVIAQSNEFDMYVDGYPAVNVNKQRNTTYSISVINPYKTQKTLTLEVEGLKLRKNFRVDPHSVKTYNVYDIIQKDSWTGQIYLFGKRRIILFLINHDFNNVNNITTLEHSDPFRAEHTYKPRMQHLRSFIHEKFKEMLS